MGRNTDEWRTELVQLVGLLESFAANYSAHPKPNDAMINSTRESMQHSPFGDFVRDFDRLDATVDVTIVGVLTEPASQMRDALNRPLPWRTSQFIADCSAVAESMKTAISALDNTETSPPQSLEQVVKELENQYLLSLAVTLTGQTGIVQKLAEWRKSSGAPAEAYLDVATFRLLPDPGRGRISMHDLELATNAGYTTFVFGEGFKDFEKFPAIQSMLYGQWFAYVFALWEEQYRGLIATAHGDAPDGDAWRRRDIACPLFGDIRRIRNDFIHNKGVADESAANEVLTWFTEGDPAQISTAQMLSLVELFPAEQLAESPTRAGKGNPKNFPWPVDPDLVDQVQKIAVDKKMTKTTKREIGNEALRLWIAKTTASTDD